MTEVYVEWANSFPEDETWEVLDKHIYKRCHNEVTEVRVEWANSFSEDETWEVLG